MKSVKIKALANTVASGEHLEAGKSYEVSESDCRILCQMGKAEISNQPAKEPEENKAKAKTKGKG